MSLVCLCVFLLVCICILGLYVKHHKQFEIGCGAILNQIYYYIIIYYLSVERNDSGVELRTLNYKNPGSNPVLQC